jgi:hypothetical protein
MIVHSSKRIYSLTGKVESRKYKDAYIKPSQKIKSEENSNGKVHANPTA